MTPRDGLWGLIVATLTIWHRLRLRKLKRRIEQHLSDGHGPDEL